MKTPVHGAGLGLRRGLLPKLKALSDDQIDFMEIAPENWIGVGGRYGRQLRSFTERFPFVCHGLSLSIGGPAPLDVSFLKEVRSFLSEHNIRAYSEHLSYCSDEKGHLYDLMPIPFTSEAVTYVAKRVQQVQDILGQRIALENVSYYLSPADQLSELEFINAVIDESDCDFLLDVNNIYVNSINFGYDAEEFLTKLPGEKSAYFHVAGHYVEAQDLRVDTHGADVIDPVWALLDRAYQLYGNRPTLLERDFNFPELDGLLKEIDQIRAAQAKISEGKDRQDVSVSDAVAR